jgi:hypothetical protein
MPSRHSCAAAKNSVECQVRLLPIHHREKIFYITLTQQLNSAAQLPGPHIHSQQLPSHTATRQHCCLAHGCQLLSSRDTFAPEKSSFAQLRYLRHDAHFYELRVRLTDASYTVHFPNSFSTYTTLCRSLHLKQNKYVFSNTMLSLVYITPCTAKRLNFSTQN